MKSKLLILTVLASTLLSQNKSYANESLRSNEERSISNEELEFFAVKFSDNGGKGTYDFEGKHLVKLSKNISLPLNHLKTNNKKRGVVNFELNMSEKK